MRMEVSEILKARRNRAMASRDRRVRQLFEGHPELEALREDRIKKSQDLALSALKGDLKDRQMAKARLDEAKEREEEAIQKLGLRPDFFLPDFFCKKCEDTGFVEGKACSCRKSLLTGQLYDASSLSDLLSFQNFDQFDLDLFRKDRQQEEEESPWEHMKQIRQEMEEEYCRYFEPDSPSLYFYGPPGTGKTFLISCIAKNLMDRGFSVSYQTSGEILDFLVSYSFSYPQDREKMEEKKKWIYESDLLALDDLGTEYINQASLAQLFQLINSWLLRKKPTLISSNLWPDQLDKVYDQRIRSRICGAFVLYSFYGADLRERIR